MTKLRFIAGEQVTLQQYKETVVSVVRKCGEADLATIAWHLRDGSLDDKQKYKDLENTLDTLRARGVVERHRRGFYRVTPRADTVHVSDEAQLEAIIYHKIEDMGGCVLFRSLLRAMGIDRNDLEGPSLHNRVHYVLGRSHRIAADFYGRGIWHLSRDDLNRLPLTGYRIAVENERLWPKDSLQRTQAQFDEIGYRLTEIRERRGLEIDDLARSPEIDRAVGHAVFEAPRRARAGFRRELDLIIQRLAQETVNGETTANEDFLDAFERASKVELERRTRHFLWMLEGGMWNAHIIAGGVLWRALAAALGCRAPELSRGIFVPVRDAQTPETQVVNVAEKLFPEDFEDIEGFEPLTMEAAGLGLDSSAKPPEGMTGQTSA